MRDLEFCACGKGQEIRGIVAGKEAAKAQARLMTTFKDAGIPKKYAGYTFASYRAIAGNDASKRNAIDLCEAFAQAGRLGDKYGLLLTGPYGAGKTGAASPIIQLMLDAGYTALWIEASDFMDAVQDEYSKPPKPRYNEDGEVIEAESALEKARNVDWLMLDDLGTPGRNDKVHGFAETPDKIKIIYSLLSHRHRQEKPTIITSNLPLIDPAKHLGLADQFGARTVDRIIEMCATATVTGVNLRHQKG